MLKAHELVRVYRTRAKKEQTEMAEVLGITPISFSLKERGKNSFKVEELIKVADALGVDAKELIGG